MSGKEEYAEVVHSWRWAMIECCVLHADWLDLTPAPTQMSTATSAAPSAATSVRIRLSTFSDAGDIFLTPQRQLSWFES